MSTATTERPRDSLWPPVAAVRDTALLLAGLVLVTLLAPNEWSVVALIAIAAPLVALTRAVLVLHRRRSA